MKYRKKSRTNIEKWVFIFVLFLIVIILSKYFSLILGLPLFGDATIQSEISRDVVEKGAWTSVEQYPSQYFLIQAILYVFFGEKGFNTVTLIGLLLSCLFLYLIGKELFENKYFAIVPVFLYLLSSKIAFYSARMYMEIFLSSFFVIVFYFLIKYIKEKRRIYLFLTLFFAVICSIIKQQGLFILLPSVIIFFLLWFLFKDKKELLFLLIIFSSLLVLVLIPPYLAMAHNSGYIIPGNEDFTIVNKTNTFLQTRLDYNPEEKALYNDPTILEAKEKYYNTASKSAESRHIRPFDVFETKIGFVRANSLYVKSFGGGKTSLLQENLNFILIVLGFIVLFCFSFSNKKYRLLLVFLIIFLILNYVLFLRNTDQSRYHLFIPILLVFVLMLPFSLLFERIIPGKSQKLSKFLLIFLMLLLFFLEFIPVGLWEIDFNQRWKNSQIYSPSKGGIESIVEAGIWFRNMTDENITIFMQCGNELSYYSNRSLYGTPFIYFLPIQKIDELMNKYGFDYIVIFDSQIVPDSKWTNFCWVPQSYYDKISGSYTEVFSTTRKDIHVFKVKNENTLN